MDYKHILTAFAAEAWAMQPEKLDALCRFVAFKANGGEFSAEEVAARVGPRSRKAEDVPTGGGIAVIPVHGVLSQRMNMMSDISGGTSYQLLSRHIHEAVASDDVAHVVLDIDSPGGAVSGAQELVSEIMALRGGEKRIIAQVNSLAASAAYWIAAACDEIVVTPSGRAGSIGVYTVHEDVSEMLSKEGVKLTYISAGKYKVEGNPSEPLGEDAQKHIQSGVNDSYRAFVDGVAAGRGVDSSYVEDNFGQGRVYGAKELMKRGMVDEVRSLADTLKRLGAATEPSAISRVKVANASKAQEAASLVFKMRDGKPVTLREFEHGLRGLTGLSKSEAERAARLYFKDGQGEPDVDAEKAAWAAKLDDVLAAARAFNINVST